MTIFGYFLKYFYDDHHFLVSVVESTPFGEHLVCGFGFGNRRRSPGVTEKPSVKMVALRVTSKTKSAILEWKKLPEHHCLSNLLLQV